VLTRRQAEQIEVERFLEELTQEYRRKGYRSRRFVRRSEKDEEKRQRQRQKHNDI